jgi:hypothetical protein
MTPHKCARLLRVSPLTRAAPPVRHAHAILWPDTMPSKKQCILHEIRCSAGTSVYHHENMLKPDLTVVREVWRAVPSIKNPAQPWCRQLATAVQPA